MRVSLPVGIEFEYGLGMDETCSYGVSGRFTGYGVGQNGIKGEGSGAGFGYPMLSGYGTGDYPEYYPEDGHGYGHGTPSLLRCYRTHVI